VIRIKRSGCPTALTGSPEKGTHYNKEAVVKALWSMQRKKCCYCESSIPESGHLKAVEHFWPQSTYKRRKNDWKNLLLACAQCNGRKSNKFPVELTNDSDLPKVVYQKRENGKALILDPSDPDIDPEDHIDFVVGLEAADLGIPMEKNHSPNGRTTIETVGLDASFHVMRRRGFFSETLMPAFLAVFRAKDQDDDAMLMAAKLNLLNLLCASHEHAAFARAFARNLRVDERFGIPIPVGEQQAGDALQGN